MKKKYRDRSFNDEVLQMVSRFKDGLTLNGVLWVFKIDDPTPREKHDYRTALTTLRRRGYLERVGGGGNGRPAVWKVSEWNAR